MGLFDDFPWHAFLVAFYLGGNGHQKGALSRSGGLAAFIIGFTMLAVKLRVFSFALLAFYYAGSRATKVGTKRKEQVEEDHHVAGNRNAMQVLCNSAAAFVASLLWSAMFIPGSLAGEYLGPYVPFMRTYDGVSWCPLDREVGGGWSRVLLFVTLGHFACCMGDTLASELGILAEERPRLITTWKTVPQGTNGAVSLEGTLYSIAGGAFMGLVIAVTLMFENAKCRSEWISVLFPCLLWGTFGGFFGSMVDSLLGATLQCSRYSLRWYRILTEKSRIPLAKMDYEIVSGYDILSNSQVNLISSVITSLLLGRFA